MSYARGAALCAAPKKLIRPARVRGREYTGISRGLLREINKIIRGKVMNKKGFLSLLFAAVSAASLASAISLAACTPAEDKHEHQWSAEWSSDGANHWHECSGCDETQDESAHTWGEWEVTKEATATEAGSRQRECTVCGYTQTETIPATGEQPGEHEHQWAAEWSSDETAHWHACSGCDEVKDEAAHEWGEWEVTKPATETETGERKRACDVCGYVQQDVIPAVEYIDVSYNFRIDEKIAEAQTFADGFKTSIFELVPGSKVRDRSRSYGDKQYVRSLQLADSTTALKINAPAAGTLTIIVQNGSSGVGSDTAPSQQYIVLTDSEGNQTPYGFLATGKTSPLVAVEIELEAGEYTLQRQSGTVDLYEATYVASVQNTPLQEIQVTNTGTTEYFVGQELDTSMVELNKVFETTLRTEPLEASQVKLTSDYDKTKPGTYTVTATYTEGGKDYKAEYSVKVYDVEAITLGKNAIVQGKNSYNSIYENVSLRQLYFVGDEISVAGLTVRVNGKLGEEQKTFLVDDGYTFDYDANTTSTAGKKTVAVTFTTNGKGYEGAFDIYVMARPDLSKAAAAYTYVSADISDANVGKLADVASVPASADVYGFKTIQQALEFYENVGIQDAANKRVIVADGKYNEKLEVNVPNVCIMSESFIKTSSEDDALKIEDDVVIEWDSLYGTEDESGFVHTTDSTATLNVRENAWGFTLLGVTVSNYWNSQEVFDSDLGEGYGEHRALAALVQADKVYFGYSRLYGYQDTLELFTGRQVFDHCYISGTTDFIFGSNNTTYFDSCRIHSIKTYSADGGYITAFKGNNGSSGKIKYGAIFDNCEFTADEGVSAGRTAIGRSWGADAAVMIMNSELGGHISVGTGTNRNDRYVAMNSNPPSGAQFTEYNNSGDGAITSAWAGDTCTVITDPAVADVYADFATIFAAVNGEVNYGDAWDGETLIAATVEIMSADGSQVLGVYIAYVGEQLVDYVLDEFVPADAIPAGQGVVGYAMSPNASQPQQLGAVQSNTKVYIVVEEVTPSILVDAKDTEISGEINIENDFFTLVSQDKFTTTKNYSTAVADDGSGRQFGYAILASGGQKPVTLTAKVDMTVTLYYCVSDSGWSEKDQAKSGNLVWTVNGGEQVTSSKTGNKDNKVAYTDTVTLKAGDVCVFNTTVNRLAICGLYAEEVE